VLAFSRSISETDWSEFLNWGIWLYCDAFPLTKSFTIFQYWRGLLTLKSFRENSRIFSLCVLLHMLQVLRYLKHLNNCTILWRIASKSKIDHYVFKIGLLKIINKLNNLNAIIAVRTLCAPWELCGRAVCAPWTRCSNCMRAVEAHGRCKDAVGTPCARCRDAMRTLCTRYNWQIWHFRRISRQPHSALTCFC